MANKENKNNNVKGTNNNVGQEIKQTEATIKAEVGEVVGIETPTDMTEERYNEYVGTIGETLKVALGSKLILARLYVECDELGAYKYEKNENGAQKYNTTEEWLADKFGVSLSEKQLGTYKRVIKTFGERQDNGSYKIADKFALYGIEKLDRIQASKEFETRNDFDTIVNGAGINDMMSANTIVSALSKYHVSQLSDEELEKYNAKEAEKKANAEKRENEKKEKTDKITELENKVKVEKEQRASIADFTRKFYGYAKDDKMDDKQFREAFIKEFEKFSKELSENK